MFFCSLGLEGHSCKIGNAPNLTGKKTKSLEEHLDYTRGVGGTHSFVWILPKIVYTNTNKLLYKYKKIVIQIQQNCYTNTIFFIQIHKKLLYKYNKKLYDTWKMKNITFSLCLFTLLWQQWTLGPPCISFSFYICYSGNFIFAIGAIET